MLQNNLAVYGLNDRVLAVNADIVDLLNQSYDVDVVFLDPPWNPSGQPWHKSLHKLMLHLSGKPVHGIVNQIFSKHSKAAVVIKVPRNFDFQKFITSVPDVLVMIHRVSEFYVVLCSLPQSVDAKCHQKCV